MPELELRRRGLNRRRRSGGFLLLSRMSLLVVETSSASSSVPSGTVPSFPVLSLSLTRSFSFLLLLLEGGLVWTALYSADLFWPGSGWDSGGALSSSAARPES